VLKFLVIVNNTEGTACFVCTASQLSKPGKNLKAYSLLENDNKL